MSNSWPPDNLNLLMGPDDSFRAPKWMHNAIVEVKAEPGVATAERPLTPFDTTPKGYEHISKLLEEYDYDFEIFLGAHHVTSLGFVLTFDQSVSSKRY
jgi:hypothetical protein